MNKRAKKYSKLLYFPDQRMTDLVNHTYFANPYPRNPPRNKNVDKHYPFNCVSKYYPMANFTPGNGREFILPCGWKYGETWGALKKCWTGYKVAKKDDDRDLMLEYAKRIQKLETQLGVPTASFPNLGLIGDLFFLYNKEKEMELRNHYAAEKVVCDKFGSESIDDMIKEGKAIMFDNKSQLEYYREKERHLRGYEVMMEWAESESAQAFFKKNGEKWKERQKIKDDLRKIKKELNILKGKGKGANLSMSKEEKIKYKRRRKYLLTQKIYRESALSSINAVQLVLTDTGWKYCKEILHNNLRNRVLYDYEPRYYLTDVYGNRLGNYKEELDLGVRDDPLFYRLYLEDKEWELNQKLASKG